MNKKSVVYVTEITVERPGIPSVIQIRLAPEMDHLIMREITRDGETEIKVGHDDDMLSAIPEAALMFLEAHQAKKRLASFQPEAAP